MTDVYKDLTAIVVLVLGAALFAYDYGQKVGREVACQSVKMEWVKDKDKCMKVTREEVK